MDDDTVYRKTANGRYIAVGRFDETPRFPYGSHMVTVEPNKSSTWFDIDPEVAPLVAASMVMRDDLATIVRTVAEARPRNYKKLSKKELAAWAKLREDLNTQSLEVPSAAMIAEEVLEKLKTKAEELHKNETVRIAYEQYLFVAKLTHDHNKRKD